MNWDVESTPKDSRLICILAPRSRKALPAVGRLWPSDDDDGDGGCDDDDGEDDDDDEDDDEQAYFEHGDGVGLSGAEAK